MHRYVEPGVRTSLQDFTHRRRPHYTLYTFYTIYARHILLEKLTETQF